MNILKNLGTTHRKRLQSWALGVLLFIFLVVVFTYSPWQPGDDWETFVEASRRVLTGGPLYGHVMVKYYYTNPPWLAILLMPLTLLPFNIGLAVLSAVTLVAPLLLLRRWESKPGLLKPLLALISPPILYILIHGQIDALILLGVFLPAELWWLVAITKPQVTLGLAAAVPVKRWFYTGLITAVVLAVSLLLYSNWPVQILHTPFTIASEAHNIWAGLWPYQVPLGVALITLGFSRRNERLMVASSPLLVPYASLSSMLGAWVAILTYLKDWQAILVWLSWWAAVAYRGLVN